MSASSQHALSEIRRMGSSLVQASSNLAPLTRWSRPDGRRMADAIAQRPKSVSGILCVSSRVEPWTEMGFAASWGKLSRALEAEGVIGRGLTSYYIRHTLGARLREAGAEHRTVADILGQRSTAMARRYSEASALPDHAKDLVSNPTSRETGRPLRQTVYTGLKMCLLVSGAYANPLKLLAPRVGLEPTT